MNARRPVPVKVAADVLAAHLAEFPAGEPVACACPATVTCLRERSALVFHVASGQPLWHEHYGTRVFGAAVRRSNSAIGEHNAELPEDSDKRMAPLPADTTSHDLRHHYASVLLAAGESVVAVAERLGHDDASLVLSVYGHLMPDSEERTRSALDAAWALASADSLRTAR